MTGTELRDLRTSLGLTPAHMANLLGVHLTTVYRWEGQGDTHLRFEPLQYSLALRLQQQAALQPPRDLGKELLEGLLIGGTLVGLAYLLADLAATKPRRR